MSLSIVVKDLLGNLDVLAHVDHHQTLFVQGDRLSFENRSIPFLWRTVTGDSRQIIVAAIQKTFDSIDQILTNYQSNMYLNPTGHVHGDQLLSMIGHLTDLRDRKDTVVAGLANLATFERYQHDKVVQLEIENFQKRMKLVHRRCETMLKDVKQRLVHVTEKGSPSGQGHMACCQRVCVQELDTESNELP
jgi:hypothetical protein